MVGPRGPIGVTFSGWNVQGPNYCCEKGNSHLKWPEMWHYAQLKLLIDSHLESCFSPCVLCANFMNFFWPWLMSVVAIKLRFSWFNKFSESEINYHQLSEVTWHQILVLALLTCISRTVSCLCSLLLVKYADIHAVMKRCKIIHINDKITCVIKTRFSCCKVNNSI